jgi:hypothetical protein
MPGQQVPDWREQSQSIFLCLCDLAHRSSSRSSYMLAVFGVRCVRGSNMHKAEYLAQTVASLMMQRAELQRLREAVEAAEDSSLRGPIEKVQAERRRPRPAVMRDPSFAETTASRL